jgi:glycosyltransferase involved in cell wall biosynthesis
MVTIESMAMEKAVVNSNFGWATELIEDGKSGFLCDPSNHVEFAAKIVELMRDDELRSTIGTNARNTVELKFDIDRIVLQNISFYQSLLER